MVEPELHEVVHQRVRLGILAVLTRQGRATFTELRDALGQSDGALSRHLGVLDKHGLIALEKVFENRRPRTWVEITEAGTAAFRQEQAQLAELLASASNRAGSGGPDDDGTMATAIVFAALLPSDETETPEAEGAGHLVSFPEVLTVAGRPAQQIASGSISARYDFPPTYAEFGREQREQRLMLMSHGLAGGLISTWQADAVAPGGEITAQAMVLELRGAASCEAILTVMAEPTVTLPGEEGMRAYLLPGAEGVAQATGVAWFGVGRHLVSLVVIADPAEAVPALADLLAEMRKSLTENAS